MSEPPFKLGFAFAVFAAIGGFVYLSTHPAQDSLLEADLPAALQNYVDSGYRVSPLEMRDSRWLAWEIRAMDGGPAQLAFRQGEGDSVVVGSLIDANGVDVGLAQQYQAERKRMQFESLSIRAAWVAAAGKEAVNNCDAYIFIDPLDPQAQRYAETLIKLGDSGFPLRYVPVVTTSGNSFDALQRVFSTSTTHEQPDAPYENLKRFLLGAKVERAFGKDIPTDRSAFNEITKNLSLHDSLGIGDGAAVVTRDPKGGLQVTALDKWLRQVRKGKRVNNA